jgi:hypothetical protein
MSKVEAELLKVTKQRKRKKDEATQDYLVRVFTATQKLDDAIWNELSDEAQVWANACAKKAEKKKSIPDFPADEEEEEDDEDETEEAEEGDEDEDEAEDDDEDEDEKPKKKADKKPAAKTEKKPAKSDKKSAKDDEDEDEDEDEAEDEDEDEKPKKKSKDKKPAKEDGKPAGGGRKSGITAHIKRIMIKSPGISPEDLLAELEKKGLGPISNMTVTTVRADFKHTLNVMLEEGALSEALTKKVEKAAAKPKK